MPKMTASVATNTGQTRAPFDKPRSTGNGGIPTHTMESMGEKTTKTVSAGMADASGGNNRERRNPNDRRFPFGGGK